MTEPAMLSVFHSLSLANQARDALLASGFEPDQIDLQPLADEAGPIEGNFVIDSKDGDPRTNPHPDRRWKTLSSQVLTVAIESPQQRQNAASILARFDDGSPPEIR